MVLVRPKLPFFPWDAAIFVTEERTEKRKKGEFPKIGDYHLAMTPS